MTREEKIASICNALDEAEEADFMIGYRITNRDAVTACLLKEAAERQKPKRTTAARPARVARK